MAAAALWAQIPSEAQAHLDAATEATARGDLDQALAAYEQALRVAPAVRGIRRTIGDLQAEQGRYEESVASYQAELELAPDALSYERLGDALLHLGRSEEAVEALTRATALAPESHNAAVLLGKALTDESRLDEAAALLLETLAAEPELQPAAQAHYALGAIYRRQGEREKARAHLEEFQRLRAQFVPPGGGESAPAVATSAVAAPDPAGFEPIYRKAVRLREQSLGPAHPRTARSRLALAYYLAEQKRADEAEAIIERAYRDLAAGDGDSSAASAQALERWAELRLDRGDGAGAQVLLERALSSTQSSGPDTARILEKLASLESLRGNLEGAETLYRQALEAERSGERLRSLAAIVESRGNPLQAERLFAEALEAQRVEIGGDLDPRSALTLNSLGLLAFQRDDLATAQSRFREALAIFEQTLGQDSPEAATALDNLGNALRASGSFAEAEELLNRALRIRRQSLPPNHPDTAETLNNLAGLYHVQGLLERAEPLYRSSIQARRAAFGQADPVAAETLYNLGYLLQQQGRLDAARETFQQSLAVLETAYGPSDPFVGAVRKALGAIAPAGSSGSPSP